MADVDPLVHVVCDEAKAFAARHPDLSPEATSIGMLTYGLLRALLQCDTCGPGVYRVPLDAAWHTLGCRTCGGRWTRQEAPAPETPPTPVAPKKRRNRHA